MNILVMGVGYVGKFLLEALKQRGHQLFITTTSEDRVEPLKAYSKQVLLLRSSDIQSLKTMLEFCDAAIVLVAPKEGQNYEETYLKTAENLVFCLKERVRPFYLIYTSSTSVYRGLDAKIALENMKLFPKDVNAQILLAAENLYLQLGFSCILRLGGIYGPGRTLKERAKRFSGKEMKGNPQEVTNHIHVEDIVSSCLFCLERRLVGVFNLVNEDHPNRQELYTRLCQSLKIQPPVWSSFSINSGYKVLNKKIKALGFSFSQPRIVDHDFIY